MGDGCWIAAALPQTVMDYQLDFLGRRPDKALQWVLVYRKHLLQLQAEFNARFGDLKIPDELDEELQYANFCTDKLGEEGAVTFTDGAAEFIKRAFVFKLAELDGRIADARAKGATEGMLEPALNERVELGKELEMKAFARISTRAPYNLAASTAAPAALAKEFDVFISHASEDKEAIARPLAAALTGKGIKVWLDEGQITIGDSLRHSIDHGLVRSRFGVVILSPRFFEKHWPQEELNGLVAKEVDGQKVILPVWHEITRKEILLQSPTLADRLAANSAKGLESVVNSLIEAIRAGRR